MLRTSIKMILNLFKSKKLALILIGLFTSAIIVAAIVPQPVFIEKEEYELWKSHYPALVSLFEKLGFTHIYTSWWFILILVLLFLNTLVCNLYRLPILTKRTIESDAQLNAEDVQSLKNTWEIKTKVSLEKARNVLEKVLSKRHYKVTSVQESYLVYAEKGKYGLWGSLFFHFALLVVIMGALVSSFYTMRGRILLTEGQSIEEAHKNYMLIEEGPFFKERHQEFQIRLDKFYPEYIGTQIKMPGSKLTIINGNNEVKKQIVYVNHPLYYKGFTVYQRSKYGFSPLLVIRSKQGKEIWKAYMALATREEEGVVGYRDVITFPYGMRAQIEFYPKESSSHGGSALRLQLTENGNQLFSGILRLGDKVFFRDNYLEFAGLRHWTTFNISKDPGLPVIWAGTWLAVFGLLARSLFVRKRLWFLSTQEKQGINLLLAGGKVESFRALFDREFKKIREEINKELNLVEEA